MSIQFEFDFSSIVQALDVQNINSIPYFDK